MEQLPEVVSPAELAEKYRDTIVDVLDGLAGLQLERTELELEYRAAIARCYTPEVREKIGKVEVRFGSQRVALDEEIARVTDTIKTDALGYGETVRGAALMAVYSKGRTTWDGPGLVGYAVAHPEIEAFKKVGQPSISIRKR